MLPQGVDPRGLCRPKEFVKKSSYSEGSDLDESVAGKMPPAEDSDIEG